MKTKWEVELWWVVLMFACAVGMDAVMDYFMFQVPHDSGFWSLHTSGWRIDAWHMSKIVKFAFVALGMWGRKNIHWFLVVSFAAINYMVHEFIYKKVLKNDK